MFAVRSSSEDIDIFASRDANNVNSTGAQNGSGAAQYVPEAVFKLYRPFGSSGSAFSTEGGLFLSCDAFLSRTPQNLAAELIIARLLRNLIRYRFAGSFKEWAGSSLTFEADLLERHQRVAFPSLELEHFADWLFLKSSNSSVTEEAERALSAIRVLEISIPEPRQVREYLVHHPDMIELALFISRLTRSEFQNNAQLSLELYEDQEGRDRYLTLYVRKLEYSGDTMARIEKVWSLYEPQLAGKTGWFLVTTDFRAPD